MPIDNEYNTLRVIYRLAGGAVKRSQLRAVIKPSTAQERDGFMATLQAEGLVESHLSLSTSGPPSTVYRLTAEGQRMAKRLADEGRIPAFGDAA